MKYLVSLIAHSRPVCLRFVLLLSFVIHSISGLSQLINGYDGTQGPEFTTQTWPAGTFLSNFDAGDRINTYHRNFLMISGQAGTGIYDISNPTAPIRIQFNGAANNGHRWYKINDLYWREYSVPEVDGTGFHYLDLSNMLDLKPVTSSEVLYTVLDGQYNYDKLETFPHTIEANKIFDMRDGTLKGTLPQGIAKPDIVLRIGNYVFYAPQSGEISVFDLGDPTDAKFLGSFGGDIPHEQYSTGIQLWRNNIVYMSGNEVANSMVAFDISNPRDVKHAFTLSSDDITLGRYMIFQDEFGFTGRFDRGVKFNFETMSIAQEFFPPSADEELQLLDNQWIPVGHVVVASGDGKTTLFSHQDGLDTSPPSVGWHFPLSGETNLPVSSTIGFVINETLNDLTLNDQTIQVSPLGGSPIQGDVTSTSYQVINYAPRAVLNPNTTYEVKFIEGGIKDAVGNGMEEYVFYFTTGSDQSNQSPEISAINTSLVSPVLKGTEITFTAIASDEENNMLNYRWNFGDASPKTDWIGNETSHTFSNSGNYTVQVQVSDNNGGFSVASISLTMVDALTATLPTQSGPIAIDAINRIVWVVNPDNNTVTMLNADSHAIISEIAVGKDPVSIALDGQGQVWITCRDDNAVYILSSTEGALIKVIALPRGSSPYGIVFTPDGSRGFISAFGSGKIIEVSPIGNVLSNTIDIGTTPRALAINGAGDQLLVTRFISSGQEGQIWKVDLDDLAVTRTISLSIDTSTIDNGNVGRGVPNYISGITIHPTADKAWSVAKKDNTLRGLSRDGKPLTFDNVVRTAISPIDLGTDSELLTQRLDIDNHGQPSSVLYSPTGNYIFVTMQGNNELIAIDPLTGEELLKKKVGLAPQGTAIDPITNKIFVKNFMSRSVSIFDADLMVRSGANQLTELAIVSTVATEVLSPEVLKGKRIFYNAEDLRMGTDGYVTCATCHIDGTQDGRVWDFTDRGEGLRNTISLRGRQGTGHGRVHWSANFDEIHDFENDIRGNFNGRGFMTDQDFNTGTTGLSLGDSKAGKSVDLDALAAYVASLDTFDPSPYRNADGSLTNDAVLGKALFENIGCGSCHSGANFTDSELGRLHDVGTIKPSSGSKLNKTLTGLDVPTLRDVWSTPPYLHDGSAATLEDVLSAGDGGHVGTTPLSQDQIDQLVAYIRQIDGSEPAPDVDIPLELEIKTPANGSLIAKSDPVTLSVNTNIQEIIKVEYFVDNEFIGTASVTPFEIFWEPVFWKSYNLTAKVFYNDGKTASITPESKVTFKGTIDVMLVVGDDHLTPEDQLIKNRIQEKLGFNVHVFTDDEADKPEKTNPFDLVLVSATVDPSVLGQDLESSVVPIMTWDPFMYSRLGLVSGALNEGFGFTAGAYQQVEITNTSHPIAANIAESLINLYKVEVKLPFGVPDDEAIVIASAGEQPIIFGYEAGNGVTSSRRTVFPLRDQFLHLLTEDGWKMFDAAVIWTLHSGTEENPISGLPDAYFKDPVDGQLVNSPLNIDFVTENWSLPSTNYKLRFLIDDNDRGHITANGQFTDGTVLSDGPHTLKLVMERSNNSVTDLGDEIIVNVTSAPLPQGPSAVINAPTDGALVLPDFTIEFTTVLWEMAPDGQHVKYFIDDIEQGSTYNTNPIPVTGLSDGAHTIKLVLAEADGTLTNTETSVNVTVDQAIANMPQTPFSINYLDASSSASDSQLKPVIEIVNDSTAAIPYSDFKVRYWFTPEHTQAMTLSIDYSAVSGTTGTVGIKDGIHQYMELTFDNSASLSGNSSSGQIQLRLHHANYVTQDQSNDYSYDGTAKASRPNIKMTLYRNDVLVWGLEPGIINAPPEIVITSSVSGGPAPLIVNFDASGSTDPEGTSLSFAWEFGDGGTGSGATISHTYLADGTYQAKLTATDADGKSSIATRNIVVQTGMVNTKPVANIIVDNLSGEAPLQVSLDASGSSDADNDPLTYLWNFGDGSPSTTGRQVAHTFLEGIYSVILIVSDGSLSDSVEVVVSADGNDAPIAVATSDINNGLSPLTVNFDGSTSIDEETPTDELNFSWDFGDGSGIQSGIGLMTVSHVFSENGNYQVQLTVSDQALSTLASAINITVTSEPAPIPVASFVISNENPTTGLDVSFDGSGSTYNGPGPLSYSWAFGDGNSGNGNIVSHGYTVAGNFDITLTTTASDGSFDTETKTIIVTGNDDNDCSFGTPINSPLPSIANVSYTHAHVIGSSGLDLSNVNNMTINWSLSNNGLYQFSMNTHNGQPSWWLSLLEKTTHNLNQPSPQLVIENSGFSLLDGTYHVTTDADNFVMVDAGGRHTIYFSTSSQVPICASSVRMFPTKDKLASTLTLDEKGLIELISKDIYDLRVMDLKGRLVYKWSARNQARTQLNFNTLELNSIYLIQLVKANETVVFKVTRKQ